MALKVARLHAAFRPTGKPTLSPKRLVCNRKLSGLLSAQGVDLLCAIACAAEAPVTAYGACLRLTLAAPRC